MTKEQVDVSWIIYDIVDGASQTKLTRFWFIDYRLKRKPHVPTKEQAEEPAPKVFYAGDCGFVEVEEHLYDRQNRLWDDVSKMPGDDQGRRGCIWTRT
ncbi:hypothetical protein QBC46DRAFT_390180 [Diplogelasinospora grovesii]|uniref:Uncharacterized protein n=1 Tax=Diplogelasinospora grovesii TaxID=303347 RepID=A0AAN6N3G4_9PEZI|nr:hypothetical protein QBC46DRAFT_390180 [Diplogelasinospora grovesii]